MTDRPRRFDAYYYSFDPTGVDAVDEILSAIAWAGKMYHHTESWSDEDTRWGDPDYSGPSEVDRIQAAANRAADAFAAQSAAPTPAEVRRGMVRALSNCVDASDLPDEVAAPLSEWALAYGRHVDGGFQLSTGAESCNAERRMVLALAATVRAVRAEARRDALMEAADVCGKASAYYAYQHGAHREVSADNDARSDMAEHLCDAIRDLAKQEPDHD